MMDEAMSWRIRGTYFESCNCEAICPCRRIDGVPGGRSTHGLRTGVLSWLIEEGAAGGTNLSGVSGCSESQAVGSCIPNGTRRESTGALHSRRSSVASVF
jgi:hypothetical protein